MDIQDKIIKCEESLKEAMIAGNIAVIDSLLHDDLVFIIPNGSTITKSMDIESYWSGIMKINDITVIERSIKLIEDCAIVVQTIHLKAIYDKQIINNRFKYLRVWKAFDNEWKIIAGSSSSA